MSLFLDGTPTNIEFLRIFESGILEVAETEGIDLDAKLSLACDETGDAILRFLLSAGTREVQQQRQVRGLSDVVATPALRRWHALKTLELVYRDAYGHQLNERYAQKRKEYQAAARAAEENFFEQGVGLVLRPVAKSPTPNVIAPGADPEALYIAVSMVNTQGEEGAVSDQLMVNLGAGGVVASPVTFGSGNGWNVYAGAAADALVLQNEQPIGCAADWVYSGALTIQGRDASGGQPPDYFVANFHQLRRG